jgi:hypothetical protein
MRVEETPYTLGMESGIKNKGGMHKRVDNSAYKEAKSSWPDIKRKKEKPKKKR